MGYRRRVWRHRRDKNGLDKFTIKEVIINRFCEKDIDLFFFISDGCFCFHSTKTVTMLAPTAAVAALP